MAVRTVYFPSQAAKQPAVPVPGKNMTDQTVYFRITTKTPLHIGCDEVYEPTSFVIDTKTRELISFETATFLEHFDSDALDKFSAICKKGTIVSLLELLKFMRSQAEFADGQRVSLPPAFLEHYESTLSLPLNENRVKQELNNFQIKRTAFDPLSTSAYIPGSAIKGSIRTAILNLRNQGKRLPQQRNNRNLQEDLLDFSFRNLESDPFRLLKVSDFFPVGEAKRAIVYAVDQKKKISDKDAQAPYQILETVVAETEFIGNLTLFAPPQGCGIRHPLTMDEIQKAILSFYGAEKKREDQELATIGCPPIQLPMDAKTPPLRLGRHSGAECVTVNGQRRIKIKQGGGKEAKFLDHATTIWLAAGVKKPTVKQNLRPFGWVVCEELSTDSGRNEQQKASAQKAANLEKLEQKIALRKQREEEIRAQQEAEERAAAEKAALLAAEAAAQEAAEEKERQALAAMSSAERILHFIQKPDSLKATIDEQLGQLEGLLGEEQQKVALLVRQQWETENKWIKRSCSDKQWTRVQRVRAILEPAQEEPVLSPGEQADIERIEKLVDWGAWKNARIPMESITLPASTKLKEKFTLWKIKAVRGEKKDAWKALEKRIRELKNV
jgi:CRISPR-associated protein Csm5